MNIFDKYDNSSERLKSDSTIEQRLAKFVKISDLLQAQGIVIESIGVGCVNLEDKSCGFKLSHGEMSWEVFRAVDVVDMIVRSREEFLKRKNEKC